MKKDGSIVSSGDINTSKNACCTARAATIWVWHRLPSWDSAIVLIIALLLLIAWLLPEQWLPSLRFTVDNLVKISPFLLLSALLAAYLQAANADSVIGDALAGKRYMAIGLAALVGTLSPFCSCGVVPLITALLLAGVPLSAVMAFWVSSPIMSPSMFVITAAGLGTGFAIAKTVAAIAIGLFAGLLTHALQRAGFFKSFLKVGHFGGKCVAKTSTINWRVWRETDRQKVFAKKAGEMTLFLFKWLSVAFILESLMVRYLPADVLTQWLGSDSSWAIPLSALIGIPAYINGFAAVPVLAGLVENGMAWGAALTFILAGSVTSIPAAVAVYSIVRFRLFVWYITIALIGSILLGSLYQMVLEF